MRPSRDEWAQALARETARRATCLRRKVGCVLLSARGHVLATGYNGVAMGMPHCDERLDLTACWCPDPRVMNPRCPFHLAAAGKPLPPEFPNACPGAGLPSGTGLDLCEAVHAEAKIAAALQRMVVKGQHVYVHGGVELARVPGAEKLRVRLVKEQGDATAADLDEPIFGDDLAAEGEGVNAEGGQ